MEMAPPGRRDRMRIRIIPQLILVLVPILLIVPSVAHMLGI